MGFTPNRVISHCILNKSEIKLIRQNIMCIKTPYSERKNIIKLHIIKYLHIILLFVDDTPFVQLYKHFMLYIIRDELYAMRTVRQSTRFQVYIDI